MRKKERERKRVCEKEGEREEEKEVIESISLLFTMAAVFIFKRNGRCLWHLLVI